MTATNMLGNETTKKEAKQSEWTETPEMSANLLSGLLFTWLSPLFSTAQRLHKDGKGLEVDDLAPLANVDQAQVLQTQFQTAYDSYQPNASRTQAQQDEARLIHALLQVCKQRLMAAGIIKFFNTCLQFGFPLILQQLLLYFEAVAEGTEEYRYAGYYLSALLLLFIGTKSITESAYFHRVQRCAYEVRATISAAVYSKSLRLTAAAQQTTTLGEMVNLMQVDATKLEMFVPQIHVLWDGLLQIAGYMTILGLLLGWPCLIGLIVMAAAGPVMGTIMSKLFGHTRRMVQYTDARVQTVNEALQGILCVKMYSWENSFATTLEKSRQAEISSLRKIAVLRGFSRAYMTALPTVAAVATFLVFAYATNREATASTLFAALVAFDQLRFPLLFYPMALAQLAQAKVSTTRVAVFLGMKEIGNKREGSEEKGTIRVQEATVYWRDPSEPYSKSDDKSLDRSQHTSTSADSNDMVYPKPVLNDLNLHIAPGQLCGVVGRVGSGKSSLCSAILNETELGEGSTVSTSGSVAYVAQSAWILNKTVRDNILFGLPYDKERYDAVVRACQLTHDLSMLENGDMTEIGERGINLSGGQKQRISVARAAYADADIVILDDPLSALDPEVASKMFHECILQFMAGKTRVLVTNQLQCLPKCDSIVALGKGTVIEQGTYDDLMSAKDGEINRLFTEMQEAAEKNKEESGDGESLDKKSEEKQRESLKKSIKTSKENGNDLVTKEEREIGSVKRDVYFKYVKAGGGWMQFAFVYLMFIIYGVVSLMSTVWVSLWSSDLDFERHSQNFYLGMYAGTAVLLGVFTFFRSFYLANFGVRASIELHKNLLASVLKAPMSFFDTTPTGRILSRFSKDIHTIDQELADFIDFVLFMTLSVTITLGTIVFITPWFGLALVPIMFLYFRVLNYFREVSRETKRLESISRSPVYSHFSETLGGLSTIRAYSESKTFLSDFDEKLDINTQATYNNKTADRWLAVRLELVGAFIAGMAGVFSTQVVLSNSRRDNDNFASLAGLSLTYAIQITGMLNWVVRSFAQVEAAMNSCERVFYYSEQIPQEAAFTAKELENEPKEGKESTASRQAIAANDSKALYPDKTWPGQGEIQLKNLHMRYRKETPLVLKGLDVTIAGGERVGVVGRTGSGKSSLLLCLLRIVEPELSEKDTYEAPLLLDGVDVLRLGLRDLRSKIGIIPQSPVLFSGTIRSNMDPFDEYSDEDIWTALGKCGMKTAVELMDEGLGSPVAEYGENLSQGQRQLLCLGRALLKNCRVLLLDEATSSVDFETDREIQRTIREAFAGSTVLTIAHRVDTIMDSDKILVLSDGVAVEYDSPKQLLASEDSQFSDIVRHSQNS